MSSVASEERLDLRPLELDVQEEASCRAAVDRIVADEGCVDVAMNNAAMMMHGLTEAFRPDQVLQILDLNAVSWLRVNRAVLPVMRRAGKGLLVYTGSGINRLPDPFTGPYAASKAAGDECDCSARRLYEWDRPLQARGRAAREAGRSLGSTYASA